MIQRKLLWGGLLLLALCATAFWGASPLVRWYVQDRYPEVEIQGDVQVEWLARRVKLTDVQVDRPNLKASLTKVTVETEESLRVTIHGGSLDLSLGEDVPNSGTSVPNSGTTIIAYDLEATIRRGEVTARLKGANVDLQDVCFESGTVEHPKATVTVNGACVRRDKSRIQAQTVSVPVTLPFAIPRVPREQTVTLTKVEVLPEDKLVRFEQASFGKFEAKKGTAKLAERLGFGDSESLFLDVENVQVNHPWVAPYPVRFDKVSLTAPTTLVHGRGDLRITVGAATVRVHPEERWIEGDEECADWFDALPKPLPEPMQEMASHFTGRLSFEVRTKPDPHLSIKQNCKFSCSMSPIKELSQGKFTYQVYNAKGEIEDRTTGRHTAGWVFLNNLPYHVPDAFRLLEDPGFHSHKGIHVMALKNSLIANLEKGSFVKGGSTISMQLAKNLWLRRHKTIGRKAQEALLTLALESCLPKPQIMELYLNVVEFGPDLYGLGPAARHYFGKGAESLTADEAFYLASILPNPKKALPPESGGLARARRLMKALANSGFITEAIIPEEENGQPLDGTGWDLAD